MSACGVVFGFWHIYLFLDGAFWLFFGFFFGIMMLVVVCALKL